MDLLLKVSGGDVCRLSHYTAHPALRVSELFALQPARNGNHTKETPAADPACERPASVSQPFYHQGRTLILTGV